MRVERLLGAAALGVFGLLVSSCELWPHSEIEFCDSGRLCPTFLKCTEAGDACIAKDDDCGDGQLQGGEQCDDGNRVADDGCSAACTRETSNGTCGNGIVDSAMGEICDDGNETNTDACPDGAGGLCEPARCGDGFIRVGVEVCDGDANASGEACRPDCLDYEACGNGLLDRGETCDDGNGDNADACPDGADGTCEPARCGDGFVRPGVEVCDDNTDAMGRPCRADCAEHVFCGNGLLDTGEICDDGNTSNIDACLSTCVPARCGDGLEQLGVEFCDDGNTIFGDGCSGDCLSNETCGNGYPDFAVGEECDAVGDSATCDRDCTFPLCGDGIFNNEAEECESDSDCTGGETCNSGCSCV